MHCQLELDVSSGAHHGGRTTGLERNILGVGWLDFRRLDITVLAHSICTSASGAVNLRRQSGPITIESPSYHG